MNNGQGRGSTSSLLLVMTPFFSVFPALGLILLGLSGSLVSACIGKNKDALGLLKACRNWCAVLCLLAVLGAAITVAAIVFSAKTLWRKPETRGMVKSALKLGGIVLVLEVLLMGALLVKGPVLSVIADAQADIRQIESGELETAVVWVYPGSTAAHLPGPYGSGQPSPLVKYYVSDESLESWDPYLFPAGMDFTPESTYRTAETVEWNTENVQRYALAYTSRLHFAAQAEPVG